MAGDILVPISVVTLVTMMGCGPVESENNFFGRELFGVKTPYLWTRQHMDMTDLASVQYKGQTCNAVYVDGLYRHGARYPLRESINGMYELRKLLSNGNGIDQFVVNWVSAFTVEKEAQLSVLGQQEMAVLGKRLGSRYQSLLNNQLDRIKFYSSNKDRTKDSVTFFQKGLDTALGTHVSATTTLDNNMLRFYDSCKSYQKLLNNDKTFEEYHKFLAGPEMRDVVAKVNNAVLSGHSNLSIDQVLMIKKICVYELAFFNTSDWCNYLSLQELEVMDYAGDIWSNIIGGYRYKITSQMSCPLFKHVFKQMDKVVTDESDRPSASFRFTHVVPVFSMYTALGLFNGSHTLRASDYLANAGRQFRSSVILPFSANLVTTMYKCGTDYMVRMMVNEEEVDIPACGAPMCPYTVMKEHYKHFVNCDFDKVCENLDTNTGTRTLASAVTAIFLLALF
ncbi:multiple inositol polyphosphate phosphatase 1-like [Pecten maximus]|uniref:multiple inositol polyphosphate phosphatase 1-like n=1 Tax=Pecten maximus TaxID=6579 RepID=UPI001458CA2C|nr:multiple inositol polyphosphate phosphatase 1-like [Pecten maximus]